MGLGLLGVLVAGALALGLSTATATPIAACTNGPSTFICAGEWSYAVPPGVTQVRIVAIGAPGGNGPADTGYGGGSNSGGPGAAGATVTSLVTVPAGTTTLYVEVGGAGGNGNLYAASQSGGGAGGFNGGGAGGNYFISQGNSGSPGGGGGGASDVRTVGCGTGCPGSDSSLGSRLVVAGGGGGGGGSGYNDHEPGRAGGAGSELGNDGAGGGNPQFGSMYYAFGGTGGVNASGVGGTGGSHYGGAGGGGGGGYLAGGGGSSPLNSGGGAGGGGGSSRGPSGTTFGTAAGGTAASVTITPVRASGTTVTSSLDPSSYGTAVTFTATVASQGGLGPFPTGQVEFKSDGTTVSGCASQTLATVMPSPGSFQQQATCTTSALAPSGSSPHEITASYGGDDGYLASTGTLSGGQSVIQSSQTSVSSSPNPSISGHAVTFTATVAPQSSGTPHGQVEFRADGTTISGCASQTLATVSGEQQATCTTSALGLSGSSPHAITALYAGEAGYFRSSTGTLTDGQSVIQSSDTTVGSSQNPSSYAQAVTFTATVAPQSSGTPQGQVAFQADGTTIAGCGSQPLANVGGVQQASCTTSALGPSGASPHAITAQYAGEADSFDSSTGTLTGGQSVDRASSQTSMSSSDAAPAYGKPVTFTATVAPQSSGTPQGQVEFQADGTTISGCASQALAGVSGQQQATCTTSTLGPSGSSPHVITALYPGDANFTSSQGTLAGGQAVDKAPSQTSVSSSSDPSDDGQPVTFTATVAPQSSGTPQGQVEFQADGTTISGCASQALVSVGGEQQATCTTSALAPSGSSPHAITALYAGDGNFTSSQGTLAGGHSVNQPAPVPPGPDQPPPTVPPPSSPPGQPGPAPGPLQLRATLTSRSFVTSKGTTLTLVTNASAKVKALLTRTAPGRLAKRRCVAPSRAAKGKRCTRTLSTKTLKVTAHSGRTKLAFGKGLTRGHWTATLTAPGAHSVTLRFQVR